MLTSHQRNNESETLVFPDMIARSSARKKQRITLIPEINSGAERHKNVESALNTNFKDASRVIDGNDCINRAARDCISPKPSSTDARSSYDSSAVQGPSTNPNPVLSFICEHCGKGFSYHSTCKRHVRSHTGEKPFACKICDKKCSTSFTLARHNRVHTGERPFKCGYCGKRFASKNELKTHTRVHTGERPAWCQKCNKGFVNSSNLNVYMRIHSGEKRYECDICGRRFSQKISLDRHKDTH